MKKINQMKKMYYIWAIVVVLIITILTVVGFVFKNKSTAYQELEEKLVEASKKYVDKYFLYPQGTEEVKVTYQEMFDDNSIDELKKEDQTCDGYVIIKTESISFSYKGYVSCPNYETGGYKK